jgi:hypothetical protein
VVKSEYGVHSDSDCEKSVVKSESKVHSDSVREERRGQVRMQGSFGQQQQGSPRSSPNARFIRTATAGKPVVKSESKVHSDSIREERRGRVRKQGSFGQHQQKGT